MYIDKRKSHEHHKYTSSIGKVRDPHYGVLGKTLMASLGDEEIKEILGNIPLKRYTDQSITDPDSFQMELKTIRVRGYAIDQEEVVPHVFGIGAPIKNKWGKTVAAVAVVSPQVIAGKTVTIVQADILAHIKKLYIQIKIIVMTQLPWNIDRPAFLIALIFFLSIPGFASSSNGVTSLTPFAATSRSSSVTLFLPFQIF